MSTIGIIGRDNDKTEHTERKEMGTGIAMAGKKRKKIRESQCH
jgi:hypothetical protein